MTHDPLSDTDVDAIINFDRPSQLTALAVEVKAARRLLQHHEAHQRAVDQVTVAAGLTWTRSADSPHVDPLWVIPHLQGQRDLALQTLQARRADRPVDDAARAAGVDVLPDHPVDPAVVITHLGSKIRALQESERSLHAALTHHIQTIGKLNADLADANLKLDELRQPVPLILYCPLCHTRHVDEGEQATREHRTHACQNPRCGHLWAPAVVATVGVWTLPGCLNAPASDDVSDEERQALQLNDARVDRVKQQRRARGISDALTGQAPTEANAEYQAGYVDAAKTAREVNTLEKATPLDQVVDVARRYVAGDLNERTGVTPADLARAVVALADDRELVRKLDAGVGRVTEALGFAPGGADFDVMVDAIETLTTKAKAFVAKTRRAPCQKCGATDVALDADGCMSVHAPPGKLDQPLCTNSDPGPLHRPCPVCKAEPGSNCNHMPGCPPTVGDYDAEFHEERCWAPLSEREWRQLDLSRPRRGRWHRWGQQLKVI